MGTVKSLASGKDVGVHGVSDQLATRYLPLILVAVLAGCGSSDPASSRSIKGVEAAAHELLSEVQAGRYGAACEAFTATARVGLANGPEGCSGTLLRAKPFLVEQLTTYLDSIASDDRIIGDTVLHEGSVQARYEGDRWRFENNVW
jgi:hypothetical protein